MHTFKFVNLVTLVVISMGFVRAHAAIEPIALEMKKQITTSCAKCHSNGGEGTIYTGDFLKMSDLLQYVNTSKPQQSLIFQKVRSGEMPPDKSMTAKQRDQFLATLEKWIRAKAPAFEVVAKKRAISHAEVLQKALDDAKALAPAQMKAARYISFAHLHNQGLPAEEIRSIEQGVLKLVNSLSWQPKLVFPTKVSGAPWLWRISYKDYGWDDVGWENLFEPYPYGPENYDDRGKNDLHKVLAIRVKSDVPIVRAEWFLKEASSGRNYEFFLGLRDIEEKLGIDRNAAYKKGNLLRAGFVNSGVAIHNRIIERVPTKYGAFWSSYDFDSSVAQGNIFEFPYGDDGLDRPDGLYLDTFNHAGGEFIFNLPNGLQGYVLSSTRDGLISEGPINLVSDPLQPDRVVRNAVSCMSCHSTGINRKVDQVYDYYTAKNGNPQSKEEKYILEFVERTYGKKNELAKAIEDDRARFAKALKALGLPTDSTAQDEPIAKGARLYDESADLLRVAGEFGVERDQFVKKLQAVDEKYPNAAVRYLMHFLSQPGGKVPREFLETHFYEVLDLLDGKKPQED